MIDEIFLLDIGVEVVFDGDAIVFWALRDKQGAFRPVPESTIIDALGFDGYLDAKEKAHDLQHNNPRLP